MASRPIDPATAGKTGTTIYDRSKASAGYNLYTVLTRSAAFLVDMEGRVVHQWQSAIGQPQNNLEARHDAAKGWQYAVMLPTGELLAIVQQGYLLKLDWESNLVWKQALPAHHDVVVGRDGNIYLLAARFRTADRINRLIREDLFYILDQSGRVEDTISLYDVLNGDQGFQTLLDSEVRRRYTAFDKAFEAKPLVAGQGRFWTSDYIADVKAMLAGATTSRPYSFRETTALIASLPHNPNPIDVFHTNTVLPVRAHPSGLWRDGDLLVSVRNFSLVAVISRSQKRVLWSIKGVTNRQHQPSMLSNNNIVVFDNGVKARRSRIVEIDPTTSKIVWQYDGGANEFYSPAQSGVQELPNGNFLVTIAHEGRAVEITRDGQVVWEFWVPLRETKKKAAKRAEKKGVDPRERFTVYRMTRLEPGLVESLLATNAKSGDRRRVGRQ